MKKIKGLAFISSLVICAVVAYNFSGIVEVFSRSKSKKIIPFDSTSQSIYHPQEKEFTYQVWVNDSITYTISLRTYSKIWLNQGVVIWRYNNVKGERDFQTGVIENDSIIWLHPPREYDLDILRIVAFPSMRKPFVVGTKWMWHLDVTHKWAIERLNLNWRGLLRCNFTYEVTGKDVRRVMNSCMLCYTIKTISASKMGVTYGYHIFNSKFGFVELYYPNIFGIKLKIELVSVKPFVPVPNNFNLDGILKR